MNDGKETPSPRVSGKNKVKSPSVIKKNENPENNTPHHVGLNVDQSLETLRMRMHGHLLSNGHNPATQISVIAPLIPMRYVRHFTVSVSLKKSHLLRFEMKNHSFFLNVFFFNSSRRNPNAKQWSVGKKQFNDNPKEVSI
jgi:hypothetical protein